MSNTFKAHTDWLTLSFPVNESGLVGELTPAEFSVPVFKQLEKHGLVGVSLKSRSGQFRRYQHAFSILRPSQSEDETKNIFVGVLAYSTSSKFNPGLVLDLASKAASEEYGFRPLDFLNALLLYKPRITRFDIAIDYPLGDFGFDYIEDAYHRGLFNSGGASPLYSVIQPKRRSATNAPVKAGGYTAYVGRRGGAKHFRGYEKAYQLSDVEGVESTPFPRWFRLEIELRPAGVAEVPYDVLADYDGVLHGMYPKLFEELSPPHDVPYDVQDASPNNTMPIKLLYQRPEQQVTLAHLIHHSKRCYGGVPFVMREHLGMTDSEIVEQLMSDTIPNRLLMPQQDTQLEPTL